MRSAKRPATSNSYDTARENGHILVTHDKKNFARLTETVDHAGLVVYTDANYLRDDPGEPSVRSNGFSHTTHLQN